MIFIFLFWVNYPFKNNVGIIEGNNSVNKHANKQANPLCVPDHDSQGTDSVGIGVNRTV